MRFKQHLDLHNVTDPGKKRAFLFCLDPDTFSLLRNLFGSTDVTGQPFDDLIDKLSAHFKSSTHVQAARYSFYKCTMQPGQSYPEWVASLRGIAKDCNFVCKSEACHHCSYVDEQIRDVIIQNTPHAEIRRQCLIEPNISLNDVMKKAILDIRTLETDQLLTGSNTTVVYKMTSQFKKKPQRRSFAKNFQSTQSEWKRCQDCFKIHQPNDCPHKSSTCYKCKKKGHLKSVCKIKVSAKLSSRIGGEKEHVGTVFSCYQRIGKQIWITAEVNDIKMQYQWDTGSTVAMVSLDGYCQLGSPECIPVNTSLMTYGGKPLDVKDQCLVQVKMGDQVRQIYP